MAFIDVDEFLVIRSATVTSLPQLLREYTDYGALAVNWQVTTGPAVAMHSQPLKLLDRLSFQYGIQDVPVKNSLICQGKGVFTMTSSAVRKARTGFSAIACLPRGFCQHISCKSGATAAKHNKALMRDERLTQRNWPCRSLARLGMQ